MVKIEQKFNQILGFTLVEQLVDTTSTNWCFHRLFPMSSITDSITPDEMLSTMVVELSAMFRRHDQLPFLIEVTHNNLINVITSLIDKVNNLTIQQP